MASSVAPRTVPDMPSSSLLAARRAHARPITSARGFTLVEIIATLALLGVLILAISTRFGAGQEAGLDLAAKASANAAMDAQLTAKGAAGAFLTHDRLQEFQPDIKFVPADQDSQSPNEVSVAVSGTRVGLAVRAGQGGCYLLSRDSAAPLTARAGLYGFIENPVSGAGLNVCQGQRALSMASPDASGNTWNDPVRLD